MAPFPRGGASERPPWGVPHPSSFDGKEGNSAGQLLLESIAQALAPTLGSLAINSNELVPYGAPQELSKLIHDLLVVSKNQHLAPSICKQGAVH